MNPDPTMSTSDAPSRARSLAASDRGMILSTLWIALMFNYLYCDVMVFMDTRLLNEYLTGTVNGLTITPGFLLGGAVLMQIPITLIVLSRVLTVKPNRWANIVAGSVMTVVQLTTLFVARPTMYYLFFSIIEIAVTSFIVWYAWKWRVSQGHATPDAVVST